MMTGIMHGWSPQFNQRFPFEAWTCLICQLLPLPFYLPLGGFQLHVQLLQLGTLCAHSFSFMSSWRFSCSFPSSAGPATLDTPFAHGSDDPSLVQRTPQMVNLPLERLSGCFPAVAGWPAMLRRAMSVLCCSSYLP